MSQLNTNIIKGVQDNDDVVIKTNNTTRITIASGGDVSLPATTCTTLSAPSVSAVNTCKAWVNWTQVSTQAYRDSFNVSGVVDEGVGRTTINFVHNFNTHDSWVATGASNFYGSDTISASTAKFATLLQTCSSIYIYCNDGGAQTDSYWCHFAAFGKNDNPLT